MELEPVFDAVKACRILKSLIRRSDFVGATKQARKLIRNRIQITREMDQFILGTACEHGAPVQFVAYLLEEVGFSPHQPDNFGATPLTKAAFSGCSVEVIQLLLAHGVNVKAKSFVGNTALHCAIISGAPIDMISLLVRNGADPWMRDSNGQTPIDLAVRWNSPDNVFQVLRNGKNQHLILTLLGGIHCKRTRAGITNTQSPLCKRLPNELVWLTAITLL